MTACTCRQTRNDLKAAMRFELAGETAPHRATCPVAIAETAAAQERRLDEQREAALEPLREAYRETFAPCTCPRDVRSLVAAELDGRTCARHRRTDVVDLDERRRTMALNAAPDEIRRRLGLPASDPGSPDDAA